MAASRSVRRQAALPDRLRACGPWRQGARAARRVCRPDGKTGAATKGRPDDRLAAIGLPHDRPADRRAGPGRQRLAPGRRTMRPRLRLAARIPQLLRDRAFRRYWSGQTISMFGDQISSIALPLVAVLVLNANPAQMGFLAALVWLPSLLFGLHAGAWVDRRGHRRPTMICADLGRAALLASIPASYAMGVLTIWQLYAVAFGTGLLSVVFTVSQSALFVAVVPEADYVTGNSLLYGS